MTAAASPTASARGYAVRPGDSLYGIAHRRTSASAPSWPPTGRAQQRHPPRTTLDDPRRSGGGPTTSAGAYTVRPSDSLYGIAHRHDVTIGGLLAADRLTLPSVIHPGRRLTIPVRGGKLGQPQRRLHRATRRLAVRHRPPPQRHRRRPAGGQPADADQRHPPRTAAGRSPPRPGSSPPPAPSTPPTRPRRAIVVTPPTAERSQPAPGRRAEHPRRVARRPRARPGDRLAESGYQPHAQSQCCSGLLQIYFDVHKGWLAGLGMDSRRDLYGPRTDAEAALAL